MAERPQEKQNSKKLEGKIKLIWKAASQISSEAGQIGKESDGVVKQDLEVIKKLADQIQTISGLIDLRISQ